MRVRPRTARWILLLAGIMILGTPVYGEEKYTVSGVVTFSEGEVVFVSLYTQDRFKDFRNSPLPPEPYTQILELSAEQKKTGRAEFVFKGIPKGTYGVIAFREMKRNLKRDQSRYFKEPVSNYKIITFSGKWSDIKFDVNRDVRGIEIRF